MSWLSKRLPWILLAASATLFFLPLGNRALWNSDEGRYAEVAREMLELKDWVAPHLNYVLYFEKPPLMYWLTASSLFVFGQNEFAARFWCALFGVLTVGLVYLIGKHWKGERAGLLAGGILATSVGFFCLTQYLVLDMALTFWTTFALYASTRILQERPPDRVRRFSDLLAMAIAGGVLTKGPIALLFPVLVLGLTLVYSRLGSQARKIAWQPALLLFIFLTSPWFIWVSLKHPIFPTFFFVHEHIARFLTRVHHRTEPIYFFVPVLLAGFFPWCVFLPKVFSFAFHNHGQAMKRDPVRALLVFWSIVIFDFFSCSQSKLAGYLLPIFPALALLVGSAFDDILDEELLAPWVQWGVACVIGLFVIGLCFLKIPLAAQLFTDPVALAVRTHSDMLGLILGIGVFILVGVWGMRQSWACIAGIMMAQVLLLSTIGTLTLNLDPYLSNRGLAHVLTLRAKPEERIVAYGISYEDVLQSLAFYTRRRIVVDGSVGELELGRNQAEDAPLWFFSDPIGKDTLGHFPTGTWVVTNDETIKYLEPVGTFDHFAFVSREGTLVLYQKTS